MFLEMSVGEAKVYRYKTTFQGEGKITGNMQHYSS